MRKLLLVTAVVALLPACSTFYKQVDAVVVTAIAADVATCRNLGLVATSSTGPDKDSGLNQMRAEAVRRGGNTVYVTSYVLADTGTAYACDPAVNPDSRSVNRSPG